MCLTPILIKLPEHTPLRRLYPSGFMAVPCGHCVECLQYNSDSYAARIIESVRAAKGLAVFSTLTYAPQHVPKSYLCRSYEHPEDSFCAYNRPNDPGKDILIQDVDLERYELVDSFLTLCNRDVQLVLKRFRKYLSKIGFRKPWQFVCAPEYGPSTWRPHYHIVFIGLTVQDVRYFHTIWKREFGFVRYEQVTSKDGVAKYVSKYASKGSFENPLCSRYDSNHNFHYRRSKLDYPTLTNVELDWHFPLVHGKYGVDFALVRRPRKMSSKGIGQDYLTKEKIKYHWNIDEKLFNFLFKQKTKTILRKINIEDLYGNTETFKTQVVETPCFTAFGTPIYVPNDSGFKIWISSIYDSFCRTYIEDLPYAKPHFSYTGECRALEFTTVVRDWLASRFNDRANYSFPARTTQIRGGSPEKTFSVGKSKTIPLPLYWLQKIMPMDLSLTLSSIKKQEAERILREKYQLLSPDTPFWSDSSVVARIYEQDRYDKEARLRAGISRSKNFYSKSKV